MDPIEAADLVPGVTVPSIGLLEFSSIALGIRAGDAMVKKSPVRALVAGSVQPGRYLVLVDGDVASVEEAMAAGEAAGAPGVVDRMFLPDVDPRVGNAIAGERWTGEVDTLGVIETGSSASGIRAADAGMKGAEVHLIELRLANGLDGRALVLFAGLQHDVEAAVEQAAARAGSEQLRHGIVIPRLHEEMAENILATTRFAGQWNRTEG